MIPYTLHVALLISVCLLFYKMLLQKETFFGLNRAILIVCLCLSFVIPLVSIPQQWALTGRQEPAQQGTTVQKSSPVVTGAQPQQTQEGDVQQQVTKSAPQTSAAAPATPQVPLMQRVMQWTFYIYWIGVAAFGLNFLLQLVVLLYQAYTKPVIRDGRFRIVELSGDKAPCSFGNNIFINPSKYDWPTYNQILLHEKIHIQQGHSFDILIAELVIVFQWFNLFAWLYRKELENNLEFLTDNSVLANEDIERSSYQLSLLKVSAPHLSLGITTNYNQSLLKKRIAMMNAKKSNINTMWKYFFLVPLLICLVCTLNNTVAYSQDKESQNKGNETSNANSNRNRSWKDRSEGSWFATIKDDKLRIEFRSDEDEHNWTSSSDFLLSEFSSLPRDKAGEFSITREAGTILFNGKFEGDQGFGHYKFTANKQFSDYLRSQGISDITNDDEFAFFVIDIKKSYVQMLQQHGYKDISRHELISMAALKVDGDYIDMWKQSGYPELSPNELVSGKALKIDKAYVDEIRKAGYNHLSFNDLISFKAQHITGEYINSLRKAKLKNDDGNSENNLPAAHEISAFKAMNIDSEYIRSLEAAGYKDLSYQELTSMKSLHITPEFIKTYEKLGYKQPAVHDLVALKSLNISPDFIQSYEGIGYHDIKINELLMLKSLHITPDYISSFKKLGFNDIGLNEFAAVKSAGLTPEYISEMQAKGFKSNDIQKYVRLKYDFKDQ